MSEKEPRRFGKCMLEEKVRRDRLGSVWRATDTASGDAVDVRILPETASAAATPLNISIEKLSGLAHQKLVGVVRLEESDGSFAIVQERVEGEPLPNRRSRRTRPYFEVSEVKPWAKALLEALSYLHQNGAVHGALHPGSIFVDGPEIQLADLGLHSLVTPAADGVFPLPLPSVAPDVLAGASPQAADDVYAFAAVLYELLTGKPVFHTGDISSQIESITPPSVSQRRDELGVSGAAVPDGWEAWLAGALSKDRASRPSLLDLVAVMSPTLGGSANAKPTAPGSAAVAGGASFLAAAKKHATEILADPKRRLVAGGVIGLALLGAILFFKGGGDAEDGNAPSVADAAAAARAVEVRGEFDRLIDSEKAPDLKPAVLAEGWSSFLKDHRNAANVADAKLAGLLTIADKRVAYWTGEQQRETAEAEQEQVARLEAFMTAFSADFNKARSDAESATEIEKREQAWQAFTAKYDGTYEGKPVQRMERFIVEARFALEKLKKERANLAKSTAEQERTIRHANTALQIVLNAAESTDAVKLAALNGFVEEFGSGASSDGSVALAEEAAGFLAIARQESERLREETKVITPEAPLDLAALFAGSEYSIPTYSENGRRHVLKAAQTQLKDSGSYSAEPDGTPGAKTHAALLAYQEQKGLAPSAALDTPTLESMGLLAVADDPSPLRPPKRTVARSSGSGSTRRSSTPPPKKPVKEVAKKGTEALGELGRKLKRLGQKDR